MGILAKVGAAVQLLFDAIAEQAAQQSGVIQRQRKFTAASLARTFVLGFLQNPDASDEALAQLAAQSGADVTPQAVEQRQTPQLVAFLEALFRRATQVIVGADDALAPILERFPRVVILDSTTLTLPDSQQQRFPGCGGSYGGGAAALKLQTELDLRSGAITHVEIEPGRSPDGASTRQQARRGAGSLLVQDLGYFQVPAFAAMVAAGEHFLSRLQPGTGVCLPDGAKVDLLDWLERQRRADGFVDQSIWLGYADRLPCRLIAWRLPPEQANRRRQKLRRHYQSKYGQEPSSERLAWCDWTILVTSVPPQKLSPQEAVILYRARWQVELLFKRWKSQDRVAVLSGSTVARQMVRVWSRLLAALVQHWLVIGSVWGDPTKSLSKACEAVRSFVGRLAAAFSIVAIVAVLGDLAKTLAKTCRRNQRTKPGTFELLNDVDLLDFCLT